MDKTIIDSYWQSTPDEIFSRLHSQREGLPEDEVLKRQANLPSKRKEHSPLVKDVLLFLSQFRSPLVLLLVAAVILSGVLGDITDVAIILTILLLTNTLSFWQERNAGKAVEKLRAIITVKAKVLRDNAEKEVLTDEIIPGDVVVFAAGDIVPADCLLFEGNDLHTNEAALTGESYPAEKEVGAVAADAPLSKRKNILYQGTSVVSGEGKAIVVNIGEQTIFGQISKSIQKPASETAFEKGIRNFGFLLMKITIVLSIFILVINIYFGKPFMDSVLFALALTIGMAPELLPAIMTVAMSAGAKRMADVKVIVKKLSAIQNLGEVNILCSDKTGTLTEGVITVSKIIDANGAENEKVKRLAFLNSSFETGFPNPMDDAIRSLENMKTDGYTKSDEVPYDFIRKRLSVVVNPVGLASNGVNHENKRLIITKGALKNILEVCDRVEVNEGNISPIENSLEQIQKCYREFSDQGFRTIGICYKEINDNNPVAKDQETQMIFAGFALLYDPPKPGIIEVIQNLKKRGVSLKVITGDNRLVAAYICKKIGIENAVVLAGSDLQNMSTEALVERASQTDVFAEIEPNQKERIIRSLQKCGNVVAYIGDGINDVAAIHAADAGISVNNAVDVAKEAADIVLLEKDLSVLERGIMEGRKTFTNTLKYIFINTGSTFGNMFSMAGASLLLPFLPLLARQILMLNFLTDFPFMFVASDNVDEERLLHPQKWSNKLIRNFMVIFGLHSSLFDYLTFFVLYKVFQANADHFRSGWFVESCLTQLIIIFVIRTHHSFRKSKPGKLLLISSIIVTLITILLPYMPFAALLGLVPLPYQLVIGLISITIVYAITAEWLKRIFFRREAS